MPFNGFISYSHAADNQLAPAIQRGLHRLAKPWHRRRALWIFRDQTGLSVTPALWTSIQNALDGSDYFVLLASPEAAGSPWVNREIEHWLATKSPEKILPVITDGDWCWEPGAGDFSPDSTAVPPVLRGAFAEEPLYLDLRWARDDQHLNLRHSRFRDAVAQLAAPMHGVSKDELEGEDVRQHKRAQRLRSGALASLLLLTFVAVLTGVLAMHNAQRANAAAHEARVQQQSATQQHSNAERSAGEARHQQDLAQEQQAKARDAAAETQRQEKLAQQQQILAAQASDEADKQQRLAGAQKALAAQARADARRDRSSAQQQTRLANAAAARAKAQEQLAQQQRELAQQWSDEAKREQQAAEKAAQAAQVAQAKVDQQTRILVGRRLINQARTTIGQDPQMALMLGTAADKIQNDDESHRQLTGLVTATRFAGALPARSAEFGPHTNVAAAGGDNDVSLWNLSDRSHPVRLATLLGSAGSWAWDPAGRLLAVFGTSGPVTLWNVVDPAHPKRIGTLPGVTSAGMVRFGPDGRTLAAYVHGTDTNSVDLWDVSDPGQPRPLSTMPRPFPVDHMAFGPDGHTLVTAENADTFIWDVTDPAHPVQASSLEDVDGVLAFSPTRPLLFINKNMQGDVDVLDLSDPAQPTVVGALKAPEAVLSMAFSADGRILVTGDYSSAAVRWNIADPSKPALIDTTRTDDAVRGLSYSQDGRTIITTTPQSTTMWSTADPGSPHTVGRLGGAGSGKAAAFGPGGRSWVSVGTDGTASFWDLTHPADPVRQATVRAYDGGLIVNAAAISPDLHAVAVVAGDWFGNQIQVTDVTDPEKPVTSGPVVPDLARHEGFRRVEFSPDGRLLVVSTTTNRFVLYDVSDRSHLRVVAGPVSGGYYSYAFSPDGRTLAGDDYQGRTGLWDVSDPSTPVKLVDFGHDRSLNINGIPVTFSPDGHTLVVSGNSPSSAALWNVADRRHPVQVATVPSDDVAVFSANGRMLATTTATGSVLWDISDPASPVRVAALDQRFGAFSPDGHTVATDGPGGGPLWDYSDLNAVRANPAAQACTALGRGLTADEWAQFIPEVRYEPTCGE